MARPRLPRELRVAQRPAPALCSRLRDPVTATARRGAAVAGLALSFLLCAHARGEEASTEEQPAPPTLEPVGVSWTTLPASRIRRPANPEEARVQLDVQEFQARAVLPVFDSDTTQIYTGIDYESLHFSLRDWPYPDQPQPPANLYGLTLQMVLVQDLTPTWTTVFAIQPGYYADFRVLELRSLDLRGALAAFYWAPTSKFELGFGLAYRSNFGEPLLLPVFYLTWHTVGGLLVKLRAPTELGLHLPLGTRVVLSWVTGFDGRQYRVHTGARTDEGELVPATYLLGYSVGSTGPALKVRLYDDIYVYGSVELGFFRRFDATEACVSTDTTGGTTCESLLADFDFVNLGDDLSWVSTIGVGLWK